MDDNWRLVNGKELYDANNDLGQKNNVIEKKPETVERLANAYEYWWQSFVDEGVNEKYAYIKVGTPYENPTHLSAMDMLCNSLATWHQSHACQPKPVSGVWKIDFVTGGE